jgi:hypothetical protein
MKKYIFYTSEGSTENNNLKQVENCQILDWQNGKDEKDAFINFKKENPNIEFENICCQELVNDKVYYFS